MKTSSPRDRASSMSRFRRSGRVWLVVLTALLALGAALSAHAQSDDPPSRAARLSDVVGQVWLYSADADEWVTVARNRPLTTGDRIATDNGARAEITLGTTTLRLDSGTELEIARLDEARYSVVLRGGSVAARLRSPQAVAEFDLSTDEGRFRAQAVGRYRFDRFEQTSDITVRAGQAIYEARNSALPVAAGQHAQFWIDGAGVPQYATVQPLRDAFAGWNDERDRAENRPVTATRFVSPEMTGAEDLDRYGQWQQTPEYGVLWVPSSVTAGWAPYTTGHWAWVRPWGWTWVDDAPWGFAPFHYGRWVNHRNAWCWAPGTYVARPVYAPALVAWIGAPRANLSISIGGGAPVGWFPLAPREVYVPSYRSSPRYVREVNITQVTNVTQITTIVNNRHGEADRRDFANRKYPQAVTFVPAEVLTRRQPVAPAAARFRNDPQVRALVADPQPGRVLAAAPVTAPPAVPRSAEAGPPPRPPFQGRAPGSFAGRPDGARPDGAQVEGPRSEGRLGERPPASPAVTGPRAAAPQPGVRPALAPPVITPPAVAAPSAGAAPPTSVGPPVGARREIDPATGRPAFRGGARLEREPVEAVAPRVIPPSPVQHAEPGLRPGLPGRDLRTPVDGAGEFRGQVRGSRLPPAVDAAPVPREAVPARIPEGAIAPRSFPPRMIEGPRGDPARPPSGGRAPEAGPVAPRPVVVAPPAPVATPPAPVAAPPAQRAPELRPVEAQRPPHEGRVTRPEAPPGRGEGREDKAEKQR